MNLDPEARKALVLIGAGSAVFSRGLMADLISAPDLGAWELRLVDTNPGALGEAPRRAPPGWCRRGATPRRRDRGPR